MMLSCLDTTSSIIDMVEAAAPEGVVPLCWQQTGKNRDLKATLS